MICIGYCLVGIVLLISTVLSGFFLYIHRTAKESLFFESLSQTQLEIYDNIYNQRKNIFIQGLLIGCGSALLYYLFSSGPRMPSIINTCLILTIILGVSII